MFLSTLSAHVVFSAQDADGLVLPAVGHQSRSVAVGAATPLRLRLAVAARRRDCLLSRSLANRTILVRSGSMFLPALLAHVVLSAQDADGLVLSAIGHQSRPATEGASSRCGLILGF